MRFVFNRSAAMLLLAVAAGVCAALAARQYLQDRVHLIEARAKVPMVQRIVAAHDLPAGTRLEPAHLVIRSFPAALASSDSVPPERYTELSGTVLRAPLRSGDPVLPVHAAAHEPSAFSSYLASGRRHHNAGGRHKLGVRAAAAGRSHRSVRLIRVSAAADHSALAAGRPGSCNRGQYAVCPGTGRHAAGFLRYRDA
jgi:hypothetical protein